MIGLPGSTIEDEIKTAEFIVSSGAVGARIYPTVVFYATELCTMSLSGEYRPICLDDAVERSAKVLEIFVRGGVEVIRIGLCASDNLIDDEKYYAGPNHPALGEMVVSAMIYNNIVRSLDIDQSYAETVLKVFVPMGFTSKAIGQKKSNKIRLIREYGFADVMIIEDSTLSGYQLKIEQERKRECT